MFQQTGRRLARHYPSPSQRHSAMPVGPEERSVTTGHQRRPPARGQRSPAAADDPPSAGPTGAALLCLPGQVTCLPCSCSLPLYERSRVRGLIRMRSGASSRVQSGARSAEVQYCRLPVTSAHCFWHSARVCMGRRRRAKYAAGVG